MTAKRRTRFSRKHESTAPIPEPEITQSPLSRSTRILLVLAILAGVLYALRIWMTPLRTGDLWFHLKTGEQILAHWIPSHDIYSDTAEAREWIINAWLSSVLMAGVYRLGGTAGITLMQILLSLLTFGIVGLFSWRISRRPVLSVLTAFLAMAATFYRYTPRPELFSMLLLVVMLAILYEYKFRQSDRILWLIPMGALWPNLHMGFTVALAIMVAFVTGESLAAWGCSLHRKPVPENVISGFRLKRLVLISMAMMAATLVNPYHAKAWTFISKLSGQFGGITEWMPLLQVAGAMQWTALASLAAMAMLAVGALAISRRAQDLTGWLLVIGFGALTLMYSRQAGQFCLVAPFVIAAAVHSLRLPGILRREETMAYGAISIIGGMLLLLFGFHVPQVAPPGIGLDKTEFSKRAVEFIRDNGLQGRKLFNTLESGGWLAWNLWPEQKICIDGRMDVYGADTISDYVQTLLSPDATARLKSAGIEYCYLQFPKAVDLGSEPCISQTLARDPEWALVFFDDAGMIYLRRGVGLDDVIEKYQYRVLNPFMVGMLQQAISVSTPEQVMREIERTRDEAPESARAHWTAGMALQIVGRSQESLERLEAAREFALRWDTHSIANLEEAIGVSALQSKDPEKAIRHFRNALRLIGDNNPAEVRYRNNLAYALFIAGKLDESEGEYKELLEIDSDQKPAWVNLGRIAMKRKQYKEAAHLFGKSAERWPDEVAIRICLAQAHAMAGNRAEALSALKVAAELDKTMVASSASSPEFTSLRTDLRFQKLTKP